MVGFNLKAHSEFFNRLIDLIPAKHYLAEADERVDLRYVKRSERDAAKAVFKRQHRDAKREKLNPETAMGTVELQKAKSEREDAARAAAAAGGELANQGTNNNSGEGLSSRDALREKLQQRLAEMRKQRKADEQGKKVQQAKSWRDAALEKGRKTAVEKRKLEALRAPAPPEGSGKQPKAAAAAANKDGHKGKKQRTGGGSDGGFTFNKMDFGDDQNRGQERGKGKRKPTKAELLATAEARKAAAAAAASGAPPEVQAKVEKEAWGAAFARAQGDKVLDDPRLLKKSMKKDAQVKKKKAQAWEARTQKVKETQEFKQNKRKDNIQSRITAKKDKKKEKREKKLMRAGFEGRKQGFITTPSPKP